MHHKKTSKNIGITKQKTIMKQMTEQEKKEFEAEWRSGLKLAVWIIASWIVFGLVAAVQCWILI